MDSFEVVRHIPEAERPTEKPIPPKPTVANAGGTEEEWDEYWIKRDAYYHGLELRKI
jgi:hypothetical protein